MTQPAPNAERSTTATMLLTFVSAHQPPNELSSKHPASLKNMDAKLTVVKGSTTAPAKGHEKQAAVLNSSPATATATSPRNDASSPRAEAATGAAPPVKRKFISKESMAHMRIR